MNRWSVVLIFALAACGSAACGDPSGTAAGGGGSGGTFPPPPPPPPCNPKTCQEGSVCVDGICMPKGPCGTGDICTEGEIKCSSNLDSVEKCVRPTPTSCTEFQPVFSCEQVEMHCGLPGITPGQLIGYCVNECGGRGIELSAHQCDQDPSLPCGVLVCDPATGTLKGDHTQCLAGGLPCVQGSQCGSCQCINNQCIGDVYEPCPDALGCPP